MFFFMRPIQSLFYAFFLFTLFIFLAGAPSESDVFRRRQSLQEKTSRMGNYPTRLNVRKWSKQRRGGGGRRPLSEMLHDLEQNKSMSSLLDFIVVGHPKSSTTTHIKWLDSSPEIKAARKENYLLRKGKHEDLVRYLYQLDPYENFKIGFKDPHIIENAEALESIRIHWPETRLIIGVRHPVLWFESFYNFHNRNTGSSALPPAILLEECMPGSRGVCVPKANFQNYLYKLGKTNLSSPDEMRYVTTTNLSLPSSPLTNPVFLYDIEQLRDPNATRRRIYRRDLSAFLGLNWELEPLVEHESRNSKYALDICENTYDELRARLIEAGHDASQWILRYLLKSPDVFVSSPEYFESVLSFWQQDPCYT